LFHPPPDAGSIDEKHDGGRARLRYRSLFADPAAESARYFSKTGIVPVNHGVVIRRSIVEEHAGVARDIYDAFLSTHNGSIAPYGVKANQLALETLLQYLHEQHLTQSLVEIGDVFAGESLEW
jgi:4,5-dihydroxyphthalate decarboxylase